MDLLSGESVGGGGKENEGRGGGILRIWHEQLLVSMLVSHLRGQFVSNLGCKLDVWPFQARKFDQTWCCRIRCVWGSCTVRQYYNCSITVISSESSEVSISMISIPFVSVEGFTMLLSSKSGNPVEPSVDEILRGLSVRRLVLWLGRLSHLSVFLLV